MKLGLAFSGGKDSLACWHLFREQNPVVFWANTGKAYPETMAVIESVRACSDFVEIKTDQEAQQRATGLPSDLIPVANTIFGAMITGMPEVKIQNFMECCYVNIMEPIWNAALAHGITHMICGQRDEETYKAHGNTDAVMGIIRVQPIQKWTKQEVMDYLRTKMEIPEHFVLDHSSMDCYDCTAFLSHSQDRIDWTRERHPVLFEAWAAKMQRLKDAIRPSVQLMEGIH